MKRQKVKHGLARIPGYTEESEFAGELGLSPETVRKKRKQRKIAAWVQIGRKFYYSDQAKAAWLKSLEAESQQGDRIKKAATVQRLSA